MMTLFHRTPFWFSYIYPSAQWHFKTEEKSIFLTFDDGPHPKATPYVLKLLKEYDAKATFFCIGKNVAQYPDLFQDILDYGHSVGNHSYSHPNGWKTEKESYLRDINKFMELHPTKLFRPPYGKIKPGALRALREHQIIMWSHLAGDFDQNLNINKAKRVLLSAGKGSILCFHDSGKAFQNLKLLLPEVLAHYSELGYSFKKIQEHAID